MSNEQCSAGSCGPKVPKDCKPTADPNIFICISDKKVSLYANAAHCMACTEKGLKNACVDKNSCIQYFTDKIIGDLYFERTGQTCVPGAQQGPSCGWYEITTPPGYNPPGICPTPQDCTTSINWENCQHAVANLDAYIYGVCTP